MLLIKICQYFSSFFDSEIVVIYINNNSYVLTYLKLYKCPSSTEEKIRTQLFDTEITKA